MRYLRLTILDQRVHSLRDRSAFADGRNDAREQYRIVVSQSGCLGGWLADKSMLNGYPSNVETRARRGLRPTGWHLKRAATGSSTVWLALAQMEHVRPFGHYV